MREHEVLRLDIPAYVTLRLGSAEREEVARHLLECEECRELEASFREIASAIREGGEAIFEPHPEEHLLREFAQGRTAADPARLERHLSLCATCRLEVAAWRSGTARHPVHPDLFPSPASAAGRTAGRKTIFASGVAAGLLVGMALAVLFRAPSPPKVDEAHRSPAQSPIPAPPLAAVLLRILPGVHRGEGQVARWQVARQEKWIAVAVPVALPERTEESIPVRFELVDGNQEVSASVTLRAGEVRRHLAASDAVSLLFSADRLSPGRYRFSVRAEEPGGEELLYQISVEITEAASREAGAP